MVQKEFHTLESWVKNIAQKHIDKLTKNLSGDLSETECRWECEVQIDIVSSLKEAWQKKLDYIKYLLGQMETEVLGAPIANSEEAEDTSKHRQFTLLNLDGTFDEAKQAFSRWKILGKRLKEVFKKATADETTEVKEEGAEEPERRPRHQSRDKDKVSTNNA